MLLSVSTLEKIGLPIRIHDATGEDLGVVHVPAKIELGDLVAREHGPPLRVIDIIPLPGHARIHALVQVELVRIVISPTS